MSDDQERYDEQDQSFDQETGKTKKGCVGCCCDYVKWSFKAACGMCDCITNMMFCNC